MYKSIVIMLICILLVACGSNRIQKQLVYKTETKVVTPNSDLTRDCSVTPEPNKEQYLESDFDKKEDILSELVASLYNDIKKCNDQMKNIRDWFESQKQLYNKRE